MVDSTKSYFFSVIALVLLASCACNRDDDGGTRGPAAPEPLWSTDLVDEFNGTTNLGAIDAALTYGGDIYLSRLGERGGGVLSRIDAETGEKLWDWGDLLRGLDDRMNISDYVLHDNLLYFVDGRRRYSIDLDRGETRWRKEDIQTKSGYLSSIGDQVFLTGENPNHPSGKQNTIIYRSSFSAGEMIPLLSPNFNPEGLEESPSIGGVADLHTYLHEVTGDTLISFVWIQPAGAPDSFTYLRSYLSLYNLSAGEYVYDGTPIHEVAQTASLRAPIQVVDGRVFLSVRRDLFCHDLATGHRLWRVRQGGDNLFSGFAVDGDRLVANSEDKLTTCYDVRTGERLWQRQTAGTSTRIDGRVLNGVVYFAGGSDGILHAINLDNGRSLWAAPASRYGGADRWLFDLAAVPGKGDEPGRIVVGTDGKAYCFEAFR